MPQSYPLAPQGVFATIQGEGVLLGTPMLFIRLAGCSVGCPQCDTNYTVSHRLTAHDIAQKFTEHPFLDWAFITGGEPTDHDLAPLLFALRAAGADNIALVTAGVRKPPWVDFLMVSPHYLDERWVQREGDQLNIVPGLNGLRLEDLEEIDTSGFDYRYVTPCDGKPETLAECLTWVKTHPGWRLGIQAHKAWGVA